jgi:hypothetical protein
LTVRRIQSTLYNREQKEERDAARRSALLPELVDVMTLSPQDAAAALRDIHAAETRSATLRDYQRAAPHFIIWGILWTVGYGLSDVFPPHANAVWAVIVPIGIVAGLVAMRGSRSASGWRYAAVMVSILAFFAASAFVLAPLTGRQVAAVIPLFVALMYVLRGIWGAPRYTVAGIAVAALTLAGFFLLREHFPLWMAAVGGGALILAGVWLRKA